MQTFQHFSQLNASFICHAMSTDLLVTVFSQIQETGSFWLWLDLQMADRPSYWPASHTCFWILSTLLGILMRIWYETDMCCGRRVWRLRNCRDLDNLHPLSDLNFAVYNAAFLSKPIRIQHSKPYIFVYSSSAAHQNNCCCSFDQWEEFCCELTLAWHHVFTVLQLLCVCVCDCNIPTDASKYNVHKETTMQAEWRHATHWRTKESSSTSSYIQW